MHVSDYYIFPSDKTLLSCFLHHYHRQILHAYATTENDFINLSWMHSGVMQNVLTIHGSATSIWNHDTLTVAKLAWKDPKEVQHTKHCAHQKVKMSPTDNLKLHSPCPACWHLHLYPAEPSHTSYAPTLKPSSVQSLHTGKVSVYHSEYQYQCHTQPISPTTIHQRVSTQKQPYR